jgi:hypothetical protein
MTTFKFKPQEAIIKLGWTVLSSLLFIPDFAPSEFHLFGALKGPICRKRFEVVMMNEEVAPSTELKLIQEGVKCSYFFFLQGC